MINKSIVSSIWINGTTAASMYWQQNPFLKGFKVENEEKMSIRDVRVSLVHILVHGDSIEHFGREDGS